LSEDSKEDLIVTASSDYKFKLWNANNKVCRKTTLGPTYGGALTRLLVLPNTDNNQRNDYVVYSTAQKVVGLTQLPLDGNPNKAMGLIAHPSTISDIAVSCDGQFLLTAGGDDMTINMWAINTSVVDAAVEDGGAGLAPFAGLIEGGLEGEFFQEICDYFMYSQLRSQGEDAVEERDVPGEIPLGEIPNIMRALGFYPTELEVQNMCSEVMYSRYAETGESAESIDLEALIRLYINHRPVFGVGKEQIEEAFQVLGNADEMQWKRLEGLLKTEGESLTANELQACLEALLGDASDIPNVVSSKLFADEMLGFEDADGGGVESG
jgi:Ca2+-binding EF-hand superfamily protein